MNALKQFENACKELALAFMKHKEWEEWEWEEYLPNDCFFVWDWFDTFADGSDYYVWQIWDMYTILNEQIPYDIAIEHMDWSIDTEWRPDWWINLTWYWNKRKNNLDMNTKDFWRMLTREYFEKKAETLSDKWKKENEEIMEKMKNDFLKNINL